MNSRYQQIFASWAGMYCRIYNDEQKLPDGRRLATLQIVYKRFLTHDPGQPPQPISDIVLWRHWCYPQYQY
jgi:hypothetical protein